MSVKFLLTMVLSSEERVFLVEYVFRDSNRYTDLVQQQFAEKFPESLVPHCNAVRRLIEKFHETGLVLRRSCTSLPTPFISAQRLSKHTVKYIENAIFYNI
jgi:hypothetical protein